ncbi:PREDICTED: HLA class II histocompatibility antigen, DP beta 1 chain-like [Colobus angolensis palliatus]|uniref:HLA class II histocompatibility antigen, DP beta 1 chain-like n=1 Tax=Colobus angolensis palliatus TaxID=336983 RepID=UPI0005F447C9|nr:PREDICTED: HLA class II histocompatibility antigen, DP beta 1 chain-like [Colobus angolensis palliatus]
MMILQVSGHPWTVALTALLMVLLISVVQGRATPDKSRAAIPGSSECSYLSGPNLHQHPERKDCKLCIFCEGQKDFMERKRAEVEKMCRHKYELMEPLIRQRRGEGCGPGLLGQPWGPGPGSKGSRAGLRDLSARREGDFGLGIDGRSPTGVCQEGEHGDWTEHGGGWKERDSRDFIRPGSSLHVG